MAKTEKGHGNGVFDPDFHFLQLRHFASLRWCNIWYSIAP